MYHVLLAVSGDHESTPHDLVELVTDLPSATEEVEVTILNVFEEFEVKDEGGSVSSKDLYEDSATPDAVIGVRDRLEDAGIPTSLRREHGDPGEEILAVADDLDVDAIVVQGRKRSPVGKALFGSVTQGILLDSTRPVFVSTPGE
ncbi:universal stress protein [Halorientalis litorea]|jgi:nucleotide-binding universal stress UspA family protein|uniref:universal stress protein n=1 Tax=Halorientalis litorea TaxID=2931977 RepID=UPI001FF10237|nr:universal stress protein [Halorientalis litorea]